MSQLSEKFSHQLRMNISLHKKFKIRSWICSQLTETCPSPVSTTMTSVGMESFLSPYLPATSRQPPAAPRPLQGHLQRLQPQGSDPSDYLPTVWAVNAAALENENPGFRSETSTRTKSFGRKISGLFAENQVCEAR